MSASLHAVGVITYAGGVPSFLWQSGEFASVGDTGVGDAAVTLQADKGVDASECAVICTPLGTALNQNITVVHTSDTIKQCLLGVAAAATDFNFQIAIYKLDIV